MVGPLEWGVSFGVGVVTPGGATRHPLGGGEPRTMEDVELEEPDILEFVGRRGLEPF